MDYSDELIRKLEPIMGSKAKALWYINILSKNQDKAFISKRLLQLIADKKAKYDFKQEIRLPPPAKDKLRGKYYIGNVIYPDKFYEFFGLREDEFIKHILITGMTGTGKTNLSLHIINELRKKNKPFLIFDWKNNYRALKQLPGFNKLTVIRPGDKSCNFRFNPLIPPKGIDHKHWMAMLIDVLKHAFFFAHGGEYFFRKGINYLYEQFGIYDGKKEYPTFDDLEKLLQKEFVRGREMLWMSSVKRTLSSLTFVGLLGEVINVRQHSKIESLLNQNVVIELDNLATMEKIFFVESLLLWIYHYRKSQAKRETFKHAIIIEEAHHILSGKKEFELGEETIIETIIRMIREFGESVIIIDQEPTKLSNSILANTNCKICFNLGNAKDIESLAKSMNLKQHEFHFIDKLQTGHAIIKLKGRFTEPIHVKIPLIKIDKSSIGTP
ncbi:MAG: ATP-binding protein [Promethearchaeota archaeon]